MTAFVAQAEKAVLSEDAAAAGKPHGKLFDQIANTKEGLDRLVSFFGETLCRFPMRSCVFAHAYPIHLAALPPPVLR